MTPINIPALTIPGALADDMGAVLLRDCATVANIIILPTGGTHGERAYHPGANPAQAEVNVRMAPRSGEIGEFCAFVLNGPAAAVDPVHEHAQAVVDAFGGNVPDWIAPEVHGLSKALDAAAIKGGA